MEADLVHTIAVPAGALRTGENVLTFVPPLEPDDIVLQKIELDARDTAAAAAEATLDVKVTGPGNHALPCRITIVDTNGTLVPLVAAPARQPIAVRPGVVYSGDGHARLGLRAGRYTVYASRGFEYGVAKQDIEIAPGRDHSVALPIAREVATPGLVSCDTHVHTFTYSRHGDATIDERALTLAGEGIELPIATDHNFHADLSAPAQKMGVAGFFTPVAGNEVTTKIGHFNIFPVALDAPAVGTAFTEWPPLMQAIRDIEHPRIVILNHPRSIHSGFRPFDPANFNSASGDNLRGPEFTFNAIELLNSGAQQTDYLRVYRDWFALLNHGYRVVGVGASDSHDVSRFIVGQARTYIATPDDSPAKIDIGRACQSLVEGRALVSMGLLVQMRVEDKFTVGDLATTLPDDIRVEILVSGPSWVKASHITLYANGSPIHEADIPESTAGSTGTLGEKARLHCTIARPSHDVHLVAIVTGPAVTAPFWAMTKPYQPLSPQWEGRSIASTNPIWLDADNDGRFTPARTYAQSLLQRHSRDPAALLTALASFDEATAIQAASLLATAGIDLKSPAFEKALTTAPPQVTRAFLTYAQSTTLPKHP
jgi:hypothetical protein